MPRPPMMLMICAVELGLPRPRIPPEHAQAGLRHVGLGRVVGAVAQGDVRDLVGQDAGHLALRPRRW